ncbi:MAG: hypothetical protein CSA62_04925 [Planctomycetota bacterium]|nr:MAG: hypothetical protein CSA62_04925 [Planctomycetota bacterium]
MIPLLPQLRSLSHLVARTTLSSLWICSTWTLGLGALLFLFAAAREPLALEFFGSMLLLQSLLEALAWALAIGAPIALCWSLERMREDGSWNAALLLPRHPAGIRLALLLPGTTALLACSLLVHRYLPEQRFALQASPLPIEDLDSGQVARLLPELGAEFGRIALRHEGRDQAGRLLSPRLLQLHETGAVSALRAERGAAFWSGRELKLSLENGVLYRSRGRGASTETLRFAALDWSLPIQTRPALDLVPAAHLSTTTIHRMQERMLARAARIDPDRERALARRRDYERAPARRSGLGLGMMLALLAGLALLARGPEPGLARRAAAYLLSLALPLLLPVLLPALTTVLAAGRAETLGWILALACLPLLLRGRP